MIGSSHSRSKSQDDTRSWRRRGPSLRSWTGGPIPALGTLHRAVTSWRGPLERDRSPSSGRGPRREGSHPSRRPGRGPERRVPPESGDFSLREWGQADLSEDLVPPIRESERAFPGKRFNYLQFILASLVASTLAHAQVDVEPRRTLQFQ